MAQAQTKTYIPELIREARGLNGDEKVFLYDLHSHETHEEFAARPTLRARTGLSERKLRRVVTVLNRLLLVTSQERPGGTTKHVLQVAELRSFSLKSRRDPGAMTALLKTYRTEAASTAATSTVGVQSRPLRSVPIVQGGRTGFDRGGRAKKNLTKEELEIINKNLKTETGEGSATPDHRHIHSNRRFGQPLGTQGVSDIWLDAELAEWDEE